MDVTESKQFCTNPTQGCALCGLALPRNPLVSKGLGYCCAGCSAVHAILGAKGELDGFKEHPLYREALEAGVISNPELLAKEGQEVPTLRLHLEVGGMWCPSCAQLISLVLERMPGVLACTVDYATDLAAIKYDPQRVSREALLKGIERLGYRGERLEEKGPRDFRLGVALFCGVNLMMLASPTYFGAAPALLGWLSLLFALPVVTYCLWPLLSRAVAAARHALWGMEALVSIGVVSAFALSCWNLLLGGEVYFDTVGMVTGLVLLGRAIEQRAKRSGKESLTQIVRSLPRRARGPDGFRLLKEFIVGDLAIVAAGERVPLDGEVVEGQGTCDESLLTGEALPVPKNSGDTVVAGSILQRGHLTLRVTAPADTSTLQQLIDTIGVDLEQKRPYLHAADLVSRILVPTALLVAFVTLLARGFLPALSVLLIACPCAIGIAAPLAEALLIRRMARLGALVRNRSVLGHLGKEQLVVFDKTGTITEGKFAIQSGLEALSGPQKSILKALSMASNHPIAVAIDQALDVPAARLTDVEEIPGRGIRAKGALLASTQFLEEQGIAAPPDTGTSAHLCLDGQLIATLRLADQIRPEVPEVLAQLPPAFLLSGDNEEAVAAAGFPRYLSRQGPLEKRAWIQSQSAPLIMVGDGINDGPALAAATTGIATAGSADLSSHAADINLTTHDLRVLPKLLHLGRLGRRIIWQNLFWALVYNTVGIFIAATGHLPPALAALAMVTSSLSVLANSWRLSVKKR